MVEFFEIKTTNQDGFVCNDYKSLSEEINKKTLECKKGVKSISFIDDMCVVIFEF